MDVTKIISWLPFNESTTQDLLGNSWTAYGSPTIADTNAINGKALQLNGSSQYLLSERELGGQDFTVSCYENKTGSGRDGAVFVLYYDESHFMALNGGGWYINYNSTNNMPTGLNHVEFNYVHNEQKIYYFVNGLLVNARATDIFAQRRLYKIALGCGLWQQGANSVKYWAGTIDEFQIYDGVALHSENFTPPTAENYADWQLAVAGYAPVKISFDVETYLHNFKKGWRVYNPGEAELLDTKGATTVKVPYTQSVTGKAFYGGTLSDMFHTPDGLKEIWIRFDMVKRYSSNGNFYVGQFLNSLNSALGFYGNFYVTLEDMFFYRGTKILKTGVGKIYHCLLHIKSNSAEGVHELTIDRDTYTYRGNVNDGNDLNNLVVYSSDGGLTFSNVVVSETELTLDDGWHRDSFGVETKINAPVLNVRLQGSNVKFPLSTKRKSNSLTIRVGDKNFYNTSVATDSTLAGAARYLLDDKARALSTSAT